jgi:cyanophycinase
MKFLSHFVFVFLFSATTLTAQNGRFLLVGGGSEKNSASGWSVPAYRWAVQGKRVAVIGISTGSLASYLKQYCGATFAKEFAISDRDSADSQITFDTLLTYQAIFFRGGDQYNYYQFYKNTRLLQAVEQIYQSGGTIAGTSAGMHILSSVMFTARYGSAFPHQCIQNPTAEVVALADDFMNYFPGYIFDTHFCERGRFGRILAFMAKHSFSDTTTLIGLGIDDMTCLAVDENMKGTVFGTGAVNIYTAESPFTLNGTKLLTDGVQVTQLLQGCSYDFNTKQIETPCLDRNINTSELEETGNYTLLASGGNSVADNQAMLADFVSENGSVTDPVLLLTGNETTAGLFKNNLMQAGATVVDVFVINNAAGTNAGLTEKIQTTGKVLFVSNATAQFQQFLPSQNGLLLQNKLKENNMVIAFAGDDSRFAGKTVVDNFYTLYASYYGELTFTKGLQLLRHSIVMPNTFYHSDMYENTATAVPYAMVRDTLRFGIWLTNRNYMKVKPVEGKTTLTGYGNAPVMIISNEGNRRRLFDPDRHWQHIGSTKNGGRYRIL